MVAKDVYLVQNDVLLPYPMTVCSYISKRMVFTAVFGKRIYDDLPPQRWKVPVAKFEFRTLAERPRCDSKCRGSHAK